MTIYWSSIAALARVLADEALHHLTEPTINTTQCAIGTKPHEAHVGRLCDPHLQRLAQTLRDIELEASILSAVPSFAAKTGRSGTLASERSPAILDAIVATDPRRAHHVGDDPLAHDQTASVLDALHGWASVIRRERALQFTPARITISGERDLLSRHLDWLIEQPWISELYDQTRALLAQLQRTNGTAPEKPLGRCWLPAPETREERINRAVFGGDQNVCGGPIWADDAAGHAHCGRCAQTWNGHQLVLLHYALQAEAREAARPHTPDGIPMLTAQELVNNGASTTLVNVRVTAHRKGHQSVNGHYDPRIFDKVNA